MHATSDKLAGPGYTYTAPLGPSFTVASQCTCPGHMLTLECTTVGPGITVWSGSAFNCTGNNILLRHSQFMSPYGVNGTCNNGKIVGYSLRVIADNCFTSQLNVTVSLGLIGQTIQCAHNNGQNLNPIGLHRIDIRTGIYLCIDYCDYLPTNLSDSIDLYFTHKAIHLPKISR